ncbi:MAG: hypothetical protein IPG44_18640 [Anaerolineales bacterium]|nr:hypothetical protein [Anaerolineales bacterium]
MIPQKMLTHKIVMKTSVRMPLKAGMKTIGKGITPRMVERMISPPSAAPTTRERPAKANPAKGPASETTMC